MEKSNMTYCEKCGIYYNNDIYQECPSATCNR